MKSNIKTTSVHFYIWIVWFANFDQSNCPNSVQFWHDLDFYDHCEGCTALRYCNIMEDLTLTTNLACQTFFFSHFLLPSMCCLTLTNRMTQVLLCCTDTDSQSCPVAVWLSCMLVSAGRATAYLCLLWQADSDSRRSASTSPVCVYMCTPHRTLVTVIWRQLQIKTCPHIFI